MGSFQEQVQLGRRLGAGLAELADIVLSSLIPRFFLTTAPCKRVSESRLSCPRSTSLQAKSGERASRPLFRISAESIQEWRPRMMATLLRGAVPGNALRLHPPQIGIPIQTAGCRGGKPYCNLINWSLSCAVSRNDSVPKQKYDFSTSRSRPELIEKSPVITLTY